jgi:hypothetical protein
MSGKTFWQDKWLHDQYNQRNPGQANDPDSRRKSAIVSPPPRTPARTKGAPARGVKKK